MGISAEFVREWYDKYWKNAKESDYEDEFIKRQLHSLKQLGTAALTPAKLDLVCFFSNILIFYKYHLTTWATFQLTNTITEMTSIYNSATVCPFNNQNCAENDKNRLTLDPHITEHFAKSRDSDELKYLWVKWHDESGRKMRSKYQDYVSLMNEVAKGNGFANAGDYWKDSFEDPQFEENVDKLWLELEPLYKELHTYMKYKLRSIYGK